MIISFRTYSQIDNINLKNKIFTEFEFSETEMQCVLVNESEFKYLIWISENEKSNLTNKELIHEHFFEIKGDFNLYNIATETLMNLDSFSLSTCKVFTKVIYPMDTLNIILKVDSKNSILKMEGFKAFVNNRLVIMNEQEAERIFINDLDRILFKENEYLIDSICIK
jgi:hypothetical protein